MFCLMNNSDLWNEVTMCCSILNLRVCFPQLNNCRHCLPRNQTVTAGVWSKNSGSGPPVKIQIKVLKSFSDSDDLPSVLIRFVRKNICSTLAFDTGSENNNSTNNKARFEEPFWLDWKYCAKQNDICFFPVISTWQVVAKTLQLL